MNENTISKKNFINYVLNIAKSNLRNIIIFLSLSFGLFLSFQIYSFYSSNKIQNNSIEFFKAQNLKDTSAITEIMTALSKENNFYGILSKLELVKVNFEQNNYENAITLYLEVLNNKDLDTVYKSAIASRASYEFIDINFNNLSIDYSKVINEFISYIDKNLESYQGIKLELNYLNKILEGEKNSIEYKNFNEIIEMYNNTINSDVVSSATKERISKIHEFFSNK